jgi:hypothetical protein
LSFVAGHAGVVKSEPYIWTNVKWGGGGYVTGIVAHPSAPNLLYIRTDVGGCFRWDAANQRWIPLLDWLPLSHQNLFGGEYRYRCIEPQQRLLRCRDVQLVALWTLGCAQVYGSRQDMGAH